MDSSDKKEYVGPIIRNRSTNALMNEHFYISEVEN